MRSPSKAQTIKTQIFTQHKYLQQPLVEACLHVCSKRYVRNVVLCYSIFASAGAYSDTGTLTLYAGTSGDKVSELANITMDEIKRAADNMNENEVARASVQMKAGLLMGLESPSSRAERLARMVAIWDRVPTLDEVVERIDGVTVNSVRNFAASLIGGSPAALALYGPVKDAPSVEELQARLVA